MNLHGIAGPIIAGVNPKTPATLRLSAGTYTTAPDGSRVPQYLPDATVMAQVQPQTFRDIQQTANLNLQGTRVSMYLDGQVDGLVRPEGKGGDLVVIPAGVWAGTYLVAMVLEQWPDWVKIAATLQNP